MKKLFLIIVMCLTCVLSVFYACGEKNNEKSNELILDVKKTEDVEIFTDYAVSEKRATDNNGNSYTPDIKVYCGEEDITSTMLDVFFTVDTFKPYKVVYTVDEKNVFVTDINVVDTTKPVISVLEKLPDAMAFEDTFDFPETAFSAEDNSRETIALDFSVYQVNESEEKQMVKNEEGKFVFDGNSIEVSKIIMRVEAKDSHNNVATFKHEIANSKQAPIRFDKEGNYSTLWTQTGNNHKYEYTQEVINDVESDVLTIDADVSMFPKGSTQTLTVYFDNEYTTDSKTIEFDIKTENMTQWLSFKIYDGRTLDHASEKSTTFPNQHDWVHVSVPVDSSLETFNSIVVYFQATTDSWFGGDSYDGTKNTLIKLANFKVVEPIEVEPIKFGKEGDFNTLWTQTGSSHKFEYSKEEIRGVESDVLTIEADVSGFAAHIAQSLTIYLDKEYSTENMVVEFDIKSSNMTQWVSMKPCDGSGVGGEDSTTFPGNSDWTHVSLSVTGSLRTFNSIVLYFQATTPSWFGGDSYDGTKNTVIKLANFKVVENASTVE